MPNVSVEHEERAPDASPSSGRLAPLGLGALRLLALCVLFLSVEAAAGPEVSHAQGTVSDYRRALRLGDRFGGNVVGDPGRPHWFGNEEAPRFWYRTSTEDGHRFVLVDVERRRKQPAFDHARLADTLSSAIPGERYTATTLPFWRFSFSEDRAQITFQAEGKEWQCALGAYTCEGTEERRSPGEDEEEDDENWCGWLGRGGRDNDSVVVAPDGETEAFVRNHDVYVRPAGEEGAEQDGVARRLSHDGTAGDAYAARSITWSPDSEKLAAYRVQPADERPITYVESAPDDQLKPKAHRCAYPRPGDPRAVQQPVLFDVSTGQQTAVAPALFPDAFSLSGLDWWDDGRAFTFEYNARGHQAYRVIEVDAETGEARALVEETPETFFNYSGKRYRHDVEATNEIIWMSERDGWNHLYLYDAQTGAVKNQITEGEWVVRGVDHVDEENRQIYFHASGMHPGRDPYFVHYFRIDFDGTNLTPLTDAHGTHEVAFSPGMAYYVDTWSRVDQPPIAQLRRTRDAEVLMTLEEADAQALYDAGWRPPEVFTAKGRDDSTDIWGVIVRPMDFDPDKKYPVIENIYAGPQGAFTPKSFGTLAYMQALAELGFIVVQMDGMGTSNRSKAFHDVAWRDLADAGFPDRIRWHRAAAAAYPSYDIDRVGIYGTSAGGQSALGALLFHPAFYDAAVSASGSHDNRLDKIWWNEQWMGKLGPHYAASSNVENAWRLQGELLLIVGEIDRNVPPTTTLQVVDALIEAGKTFDLLFMPGYGHTSGGAYGRLARFDFFVEHLLGVAPPNWNDRETAEAVPLPWSDRPEPSATNGAASSRE